MNFQPCVVHVTLACKSECSDWLATITHRKDDGRLCLDVLGRLVDLRHIEGLDAGLQGRAACPGHGAEDLHTSLVDGEALAGLRPSMCAAVTPHSWFSHALLIVLLATYS